MTDPGEPDLPRPAARADRQRQLRSVLRPGRADVRGAPGSRGGMPVAAPRRRGFTPDGVGRRCRPQHAPTNCASNSLWRDIEVYADHAFIGSEQANHGLVVFDLRQLRTVLDRPRSSPTTARGPASTATRTPRASTPPPGSCTPTAPTRARAAAAASRSSWTSEPRAPVFAGLRHRRRLHPRLAVLRRTRARTPRTSASRSASTRTDRRQATTAGHRRRHERRRGRPPVQHRLLRRRLHPPGLGHRRPHATSSSTTSSTRRTSAATRGRTSGTSPTSTRPSLIGVHTGSTAAIDHQQFIHGNFTYQSNYRAGLRILETKDMRHAGRADRGRVLRRLSAGEHHRLRRHVGELSVLPQRQRRASAPSAPASAPCRPSSSSSARCSRT